MIELLYDGLTGAAQRVADLSGYYLSGAASVACLKFVDGGFW
jgi:hypothetical protein